MTEHKYAIYLWFGAFSQEEFPEMEAIEYREGWSLHNCDLPLMKAYREVKRILLGGCFSEPTLLFVRHDKIPPSQLKNGELPEYLYDWETTPSLIRKRRDIKAPPGFRM